MEHLRRISLSLAPGMSTDIAIGFGCYLSVGGIDGVDGDGDNGLH
jgi:hypothetical protein